MRCRWRRRQLGAGTLNAAFLKFFSLKANADTVALIGVPELDLRVDVLEVRVNQGSYVPGAWPVAPGLFPPPVIDFATSFPTGTYATGDPNNLTDPEDPTSAPRTDGYRVQTGTSAGLYQALYFDDGVVGASADRVLLRVSDFVYVSGGFSFNKGGVEYVDVQTNLNSTQSLSVLGALQTSGSRDNADGSTVLGASEDGSMIFNLPIQTIEMGLSNVDVFVGYSTEVSEDLNGDLIFNDGSDALHPLLNETADDKDYNRDGDKDDTALSEDLSGDGAFGTYSVLAYAAQESGELTEEGLGAAGAIGLLLDEASLGMLLGRRCRCRRRLWARGR